MPLSDNFPPEIVAQHQAKREALYRAQIVPGAVIKLPSNRTTPPKLKRFLVVNADPLKLFIVNSKIFARYLNKQKWAIPYQVAVVPDGACFDGDCVIDCSNFWDEFDFEEVVRQCLANTCTVLGNISDDVCVEVCDAVSGHRPFSPPEVSLITENLSR